MQYLQDREAMTQKKTCKTYDVNFNDEEWKEVQENLKAWGLETLDFPEAFKLINDEKIREARRQGKQPEEIWLIMQKAEWIRGKE